MIHLSFYDALTSPKTVKHKTRSSKIAESSKRGVKIGSGGFQVFRN